MNNTPANLAAKRVGLIATGSELTSGEILNTNGQVIAKSLQQNGIEIGEHLSCDDQKNNVIAAIEFMLSRHDAIILTGGLGPTSDDTTRFALAQVINQPLVFFDPSWKRINERFQKRKLAVSENNRQQALFPQNAQIYVNEMGTADGCMLKYQHKLIFMLPGPPRECLPIFHNEVLPCLLQHHFGSEKRLHRWRLMGIGESAIAEQLETLAEPYHLEFAYRAAYPYIDVKLMLSQDAQYPQIIAEVNKIVSPYFVTHRDLGISQELKQALSQFNQVLTLCDFATKGALLSALSAPDTQTKLLSATSLTRDYCVVIEGLQEYWQPEAHSVLTQLNVSLHHGNETHNFHTEIFLRGDETLEYAVEFTCHKIYELWIKPLLREDFDKH